MTTGFQRRAFDAWLESEGYRGTTRLSYLSALRYIDTHAHELGPSALWSRRFAIRAYLRFAEGQEDDFSEWLAAQPLEPAGRQTPAQKRKRRRAAAAFEPEDWQTLRAHLAEDPEPEARALELMALTGSRVGDVLRLRRTSVRRAVREGGYIRLEVKGGAKRRLSVDAAPEVWERLLDQWHTGATLADWISPRSAQGALSGFGAYKAVYRHLGRVATALKLDGRTYTHRFRRTVAQRALQVTRDIYAVKELLGHSHIVTTQKYLHGVDYTEAVTELQKKLHAGARSTE